MQKIHKKMQAMIKRLLELGYTVGDRYSRITIFDMNDTEENPEGNPVQYFN